MARTHKVERLRAAHDATLQRKIRIAKAAGEFIEGEGYTATSTERERYYLELAGKWDVTIEEIKSCLVRP